MIFLSPRRSFLLTALSAAAGLAVPACARQNRCKTCGMVIDSSSRFLVVLPGLAGASGNESFDTPKCAFQALRTAKAPRALFAKGYYTQKNLDSRELLFAAGSDVLGPMGIDLVPVEREYGARFAREHEAKHLYEADDVTLDVLRDLS